MDLLMPEFGLFFWQTVTFLFVLIVLKKFAWKKILNTIKEREEYIDSTFKKAESAERIINSVNQTKENILKEAEKEREKIINEGFSTKSSLIEEAKKESAVIINAAIKRSEEMVAHERQQALLKLQEEVAVISTMIAEKLIIDHLSGSNKQEDLIKNLLNESIVGSHKA